MELADSVFIDSSNKAMSNSPDYVALTRCSSNTELVGTEITLQTDLIPIIFEITVNFKECDINYCTKDDPFLFMKKSFISNHIYIFMLFFL